MFRRLHVLIHAGFVVNLKKSELAPTQDLVYIGVRDSARTWADSSYRRQGSRQALIACVRSFSKVGAYKPAHQYLSAGADGSYAAVSGICPPPHVTHLVVPEAALDPHNPRVASPNPYQQRPGPHAPLVVRQATPVSGNAVYGSQYHHYHYGCQHGGVGWPLYCAWVRHSALQRPLDSRQTPVPHQCVKSSERFA